MGRRAAFVDRDGVVNVLAPDPVSGLPESPLRVADVALMPGAAAALRQAADLGWVLVGVSNQPAAAKGLVSVAELEAVQSRVVGLLDAEGVRFDAFRMCLHHPDGVVASLSGPCRCRKPAPGLLLDAAAELGIDVRASWMIGDTDSDVLAGRGAGCRTALVLNGSSAHKRSGDVGSDLASPDLAAALACVIALE
jgi:D-glycero-D-manno-heptose 1,7-bisphosphate phosphatase